MNKLQRAGILAVAVAMCGRPLTIFAQVGVSVGVNIHAEADFDAPLAAGGAWVAIGGHPHCWRPSGLAVDWRPYSVGEWVWTDDGWYWQSDEPFAWACYHYGYWIDDPSAGWVWAPGIEWSPAWVEWRTGGGYVGWAPCGPPGVVVAPAFFGFVAIGHFGDPIRPGVLVINNRDIINRTTVLRGTSHASINIGGASVRATVNVGPKVEDIERASGHKVTRIAMADAVRRTPPPRVAPGRRAEPARTEPVRTEPRRGETARPVEPPREDRPRVTEPPKTIEPARPVEPPREDRPRVTEPPKIEPGRGAEPPRRGEPPARGVPPPERGRDGGVAPKEPAHVEPAKPAGGERRDGGGGMF